MMLPQWTAENSDGSSETSSATHPDAEASAPPVADDRQERARLTAKFEAELRAGIGTERFEKWFVGQCSVAINGDRLIVGVISPFTLNWMKQQFHGPAQAAAQVCLGPSADVTFEVDPHLQQSLLAQATSPPQLNETTPLPDARTTETPRQQPADRSETSSALLSFATPIGNGSSRRAASPSRSGTTDSATNAARRGTAAPRGGLKPMPANRLRRYARLDGFICGETPQIACKMARLVADAPGELYNPFYLYGGVGLGKTHLLEGIHAHTRKHFPELLSTYMTAEGFANYYTDALRQKSLAGFRRKFRSVDVLIIDDVEFLDEKRGLQEEFCHTIQDLIAHGRQVVLAADRHPRMLTNIRPDLCSRFLAGLVSRLEPPDLSARQQILKHQATTLAVPITDDAIHYVAHKFSRNVRELTGALHCLQTYHHFTKRTVGITAAREVLRDLERDCLRVIRACDIQNAVCDLFGVSRADLVSARKTKTLTRPRMFAMYLTRRLTQAAYQEIGQQFGGRNHSTVIAAERKLRQWLKTNEPVQIAAREWTPSEILAFLEEQLQAG